MAETIPAQNEFPNAPVVQPEPVERANEPSFTAPPVDHTPEVDHLAIICELARGLRTTSPSGAETIGDKILFHLDAIANPDEYQAKVEADQKAEDELEAQRKDQREKLKAKPETEKV